MPLLENIAKVKKNIAAAARSAGRDPDEVTLVAATKVQSSDTIRAAIAAGITVCGENRVQELTAHLADYAYDGARVHFIGHLQTNKVKYVVGRVDLIESVDSPRLLEVNIAGEESKGGCPASELPTLARLARSAGHVRLRGLMCIPPVAAAPGDNCMFFRKTRQLFVDIRMEMGDNDSDIDCLSMGMSGDYEDAVREGATLVRVGTALFGPRPPVHAGTV